MDVVENKLHRLSPSQLRALLLLAKAKNGVISSSVSGKSIGKEGKALGGVFSSLSRQKIGNQTIVIPWGKSESGRGLRWKLNSKLISQKRLLAITKELLF